jgi:serine/threonine-protein kinase
MTFNPGDTIDGKYRIVGLLGEGGMGAVYEGENTRIHRRVAIKVLHTAVAAKADVVQRFEREAQAAGRIGSEHIVEVLDLGTAPDGERYMVMEFLEGESLGERIRRKQRLPPQEIVPILHEILEGLGAAHGAGIVHRDLKPDNVFLLHSRSGRRDFVKILDFGVSKFAALESELSMTKSGAVMGTPFYMSPEQARGQEVDGRSDLYSAGVVAYQAVTGRVPFQAATFNELVFKIALESPEPAELHTPGLDRRFSALIARAMVRDPAGRFQSAREFQAALAAWAADAGVPLDRSGAHPAVSVNGAVSGSIPGASAAELGLAKTVVPGDEIAPAADSAPGRRRRRFALGAASLLALCAGGLGAYWLVGAPSHAAPSSPATVTAAAPPRVMETAPPVIETAAPVPSAAPVEPAASATPSASPSVVPSATPSAEPAGGRAPKPKASAAPKPSAAPTVAPVVPLVPSGRAIGSEL